MTEIKNPFLIPYNTPHDTAPFHLIKIEHYEPAILEGIKEQNEEIDAIINNPEVPTFQNTIVALERSGTLLERVTTVFGNLLSAETSDEMQEMAEKMMPILAEHSNSISLNEKLFARIKAVYEQKDQPGLNGEDKMLLQKTYDGFVRSGANLTGEAKEKYRRLNTELSVLSLRFSQNLLKETNNYELPLTTNQLDGLPEGTLESYAQTAKDKGKEGNIITLDAPSFVPFMKYCTDRTLRRQLYMAYNTQCAHDNEFNNMDVIKQLVNIRMELVQLLGYPTYADYVLKKRMAETSDAVYNLLNQLLDAYTPTAQKEVAEVEALAHRLEGDDFQLMPWDWTFYSEKLKNEKFNLNEEELRPYFELSRVKEGVFGLATRLYGITFKENKEIPVYHPDVNAYEVFDKNGSFLAVLYTDFHPRAGKRSGAWMTSYKEQWIENGVNSRPHVSVTMNFTKPTADKPALLTFNEVNTFLHEFGHALHGMFANSTYPSMSGTSVYWDFVELPSQIMENFAIEKEFLNTFAKHYQTGEQIPAELIQKIVDASNFNVAYACLRQVSFGLLDMAWYTRKEAFDGDVRAYEKEAWKKAQILPSVDKTCMSVQFSHIMAGGYSAGYYSYKWAEVLDADAFSLFKEKGIFNREVATSFRENILSKGGTEHPMVLYKRFRGQEPSIHALLKRNGIIN
ncbi:M3 family metallopeptidase [Phocaeicola sp.]